MSLISSPAQVEDLRRRVDRLDPAVRAMAAHEFGLQVQYLEDAIYGLRSRGRYAAVGDFRAEHPDLPGLMRRMLLRARAFGDTANEVRLMTFADKLAPVFQVGR